MSLCFISRKTEDCRRFGDFERKNVGEREKNLHFQKDFGIQGRTERKGKIKNSH